MKPIKNETAAFEECMTRLYKNSKPKADWAELKDKKGDYFLDYEIDYGLMDVILDNVIEEFKIKPKYRAEVFKTSVYLGPSPKYSTNHFEEKKKIHNFDE